MLQSLFLICSICLFDVNTKGFIKCYHSSVLLNWTILTRPNLIYNENAAFAMS